VLVPASVALGYDLDPTTVGAVEDSVPGITTAQVTTAVTDAYGACRRGLAGSSRGGRPGSGRRRPGTGRRAVRRRAL